MSLTVTTPQDYQGTVGGTVGFVDANDVSVGSGGANATIVLPPVAGWSWVLSGVIFSHNTAPAAANPLTVDAYYANGTRAFTARQLAITSAGAGFIPFGKNGCRFPSGYGVTINLPAEAGIPIVSIANKYLTPG